MEELPEEEGVSLAEGFEEVVEDVAEDVEVDEELLGFDDEV